MSLKRTIATLDSRSGKPKTGQMPMTMPVASDRDSVTGDDSD